MCIWATIACEHTPAHAARVCLQAQTVTAAQAGTLQQSEHPLPPPLAPLQRPPQPQQQQFQQLQGAVYAMPGEQHSMASWQPAANDQHAALPAFHGSRQQGMSYQDQVRPSSGVGAAIHPPAN